MKLKEVIKLLQKDGWFVFKSYGKCKQLRHPIKLGIITILGDPKNKLANQSLKNIFDIAGI